VKHCPKIADCPSCDCTISRGFTSHLRLEGHTLRNFDGIFVVERRWVSTMQDSDAGISSNVPMKEE
jgi:hypothetical protein